MRARFLLLLFIPLSFNSCKCYDNVDLTDKNSISVLQLRLLYESHLKDKIDSNSDRSSTTESFIPINYEQNQQNIEYHKIKALNCDEIEQICPGGCSQPETNTCRRGVKATGKCHQGSCPTELPDFITHTYSKYLDKVLAVINIKKEGTNEVISSLSLNPINSIKTSSKNTVVQKLTNVKLNVTYTVSVTEYRADGTNLSYSIPNVIFK